MINRMYNAKDYFNSQTKFYGDVAVDDRDRYFVDFINNRKAKKISNFLDIGGASGVYADFFNQECENLNITIVDPSDELLDKNHNDKIIKIVAELPNIKLTGKYDYIHVKEVFHHVVGNSVGDTRDLLAGSLSNISGLMDDNGYLLVHEVYYESFLIPSLTSRIIFTVCSLKNKFGLTIPISDFRNGLKVYFYGRKEFEKILWDSGFEIVDQKEVEWKIRMIEKYLLFLRNWGRMMFICKKRRGHED